MIQSCVIKNEQRQCDIIDNHQKTEEPNMLVKLMLQIVFIAFVFIFIRIVGKKTSPGSEVESNIEIDSGSPEDIDVKDQKSASSFPRKPDDGPIIASYLFPIAYFPTVYIGKLV